MDKKPKQDTNKYRKNHPELPVIYVHMHKVTKAVLKAEAKSRKMSMAALVREILDNGAMQLDPTTMRRKK